MKTHHNHTALAYAAAAGLAGGIGFVTGVLIAPASGREVRRRWRWWARDEVEALERRSRRAVEDVTRRARVYVAPPS